MVALTERQADTYEILEREVRLLEISNGRVSKSRLLRVSQHATELSRMCRTLEGQLTREDDRLRTDGTTPEFDDRWITNLRRLERMLALLDRTKAALP